MATFSYKPDYIWNLAENQSGASESLWRLGVLAPNTAVSWPCTGPSRHKQQLTRQ